ncbi:hypothetical protein [uncultured Methanobrevibacter sp.]|uniref:hypothetical protein n=1 Tax=uncultured Methanobrevibacter sp. TaxID=253161 RepID=UPI0025E56AE4|nr:hypothetical protein [uncultured Methanobrevibacter sp.]
MFDGVNYYSSSKTVNVEVVDKVLNTTVVVDDVVCVVDEFVVLNASVFDENGDLVSNGNVTWVVGDDSFVCPVVNGSAFRIM